MLCIPFQEIFHLFTSNYFAKWGGYANPRFTTTCLLAFGRKPQDSDFFCDHNCQQTDVFVTFFSVEQADKGCFLILYIHRLLTRTRSTRHISIMSCMFAKVATWRVQWHFFFLILAVSKMSRVTQNMTCFLKVMVFLSKEPCTLHLVRTWQKTGLISW